MRPMTKHIVLGLAFALALGSVAAADEAAPTTITIPGMHCGSCAKKVSAKLIQVQGVAKAEPDMKTKTIRVTPKAQAAISPRALWEAVEAGAQVPTRLKGPSGTFTKKPKD